MWRRARTPTYFIPLALLLLLGTAIHLFTSGSLEPTVAKRAPPKKAIIFVYNRVPKSGSSSTNYLFKTLSARRRRFVYRHSSEYFHLRFTDEQQVKLSETLTRLAHNFSGRPLLYDQHFHFFHMPETSEAIFKYINVIRDPLGQALSSFNFARYKYSFNPSNPLARRLLPSAINMSMDECVLSGDPARCLTTAYGARSMISFFCGQSSICDDRLTRPISDAALSLAKANIERYYLWIGVLESFEASLWLLEFLEPSIFNGITNCYRKKMKHDPRNVTPDEYRDKISDKTRDILLRLLEPEYELYRFVRKRLMDQHRLMAKVSNKRVRQQH